MSLSLISILAITTIIGLVPYFTEYDIWETIFGFFRKRKQTNSNKSKMFANKQELDRFRKQTSNIFYEEKEIEYARKLLEVLRKKDKSTRLRMMYDVKEGNNMNIRVRLFCSNTENYISGCGATLRIALQNTINELIERNA